MSEREGTNEPGGADEVGAARDALHSGAIELDQTQLRVQMAMDRKAKLMQTVSNVVKKASETSDKTIENLK